MVTSTGNRGGDERGVLTIPHAVGMGLFTSHPYSVETEGTLGFPRTGLVIDHQVRGVVIQHVRRRVTWRVSCIPLKVLGSRRADYLAHGGKQGGGGGAGGKYHVITVRTLGCMRICALLTMLFSVPFAPSHAQAANTQKNELWSTSQHTTLGKKKNSDNQRSPKCSLIRKHGGR